MSRLLSTVPAAVFAAVLGAQAAFAQQPADEDAPEPGQETGTPGMAGEGMDPDAGEGMMGQGMMMGRGMMGQGMGHGMGHGMMGHGMRHGMKGKGMPPGMMVVLFTLIDTDGNEALSLEEFMAPHERMFQRMDEDDDGEVSLEELQGFMRQLHGG